MNHRHVPTAECEGRPVGLVLGGRAHGPFACYECGQTLCPCEMAYGHDCEN